MEEQRVEVYEGRPVGVHLTPAERETLGREAWKLTVERVPQYLILERLNIADRTYHSLIKEQREAMDKDIDSHFDKDLALIERLLKGAIRKYELTHATRDFEAVEKMLARKAKMLGYDRETMKATIQHVIVDPKDIELSELINEANAKAAADRAMILAEDSHDDA